MLEFMLHLKSNPRLKQKYNKELSISNSRSLKEVGGHIHHPVV